MSQNRIRSVASDSFCIFCINGNGCLCWELNIHQIWLDCTKYCLQWDTMLKKSVGLFPHVPQPFHEISRQRRKTNYKLLNKSNNLTLMAILKNNSANAIRSQTSRTLIIVNCCVAYSMYCGAFSINCFLPVSLSSQSYHLTSRGFESIIFTKSLDTTIVINSPSVTLRQKILGPHKEQHKLLQLIFLSPPTPRFHHLVPSTGPLSSHK